MAGNISDKRYAWFLGALRDDIVIPEPLFQQGTSLGMNLGAINDYNGQWDFVDVMRASRDWITTDAGGGGAWDTGLADQINKDANGYPLEIPQAVAGQPDQEVRKVIINGSEAFPEYTFTVLFDGDGDLNFAGHTGGTDARISSNEYTVTVPAGLGLWMEIERSDVADPVKNLRMIIAGYEDTYLDNPFHPSFINRLEGFGTIRFMDYMNTNDKQVSSWSDRTLLNSHTQSLPDGCSVELMVQLANLLNANAWFTLGHQADDNYITQFANYVAANLNPNLNVYLEHSNELWNNQFDQTGDTYAIGCANGDTFTPHTAGSDWGVIGCDDGTSGKRHTIKRTNYMIDAFESAFGGGDRVIGVLGSQSTSEWQGQQLMEIASNATYFPEGLKVKALAIAPYFGDSVPADITSEGLISTITLDEILQRCEDHMISNSFVDMAENKVTTDLYGVDLICYEGGQHLADNAEDPDLVAKLIAANVEPRMRVLYEAYFTHWFTNYGGVFANFAFVAFPSKFGSWGAIVSQDEDIVDAPKWQALRFIQEDYFGFVYENAEVIPVIQ